MQLYTWWLRLSSVLGLLLVYSQSNAQQASDSLWSFSKVRMDANADDTLDYLGEEVTITGIANIETGLLHEHYLQAFVQNDSSGMSVFSMEIDTHFEPGDSIVATGEIQRYNGLAEVNVKSYEVFEDAAEVPDPKPLNEAAKNPAKYLGMLVAGEGRIIEKGNTFNGKYLRLSTADELNDPIIIYVSNFHHLFDEIDFDVLGVGDKISVTGIMSEYNPDFPEERMYKVFLRTPEDLDYADLPRFYMLLIIGGMGLVTLLIVGWVVMLRRQVDNKTKKIQESLEEKEILLREIHHRVKNSLAIVSGLIELQLDSTNNKTAKSVLQDSQSRIRSMALIHEKLYQTESLSGIDLDTYLKELVEAIHGTFTEYQKAVELQFDLENIKMDIDRVIPCGLLINELVVNAFKHAFTENKQGVLAIELARENGEITLRVSDNGPGLPEYFNLNDQDSLGAMLIGTFASQLEAETKINKKKEGSEFIFTFPTNE